MTPPVVPPAPVFPPLAPVRPPVSPPPEPVDWQALMISTWTKKMERPIDSRFVFINGYCRNQDKVVTKSESGQDEAV